MSEERRFPWRTLLFTSAALNVLVVGAVVGAVASGARLERQNASAVVERMPGPRVFVSSLPEEVRAPVRAELARSWRESREARRAAADARRAAFLAASTEPYDVERVRAAFARLRAADQAALAVYHDNIAEAFAQMTPEQRRASLAALRRAAPARREAVAPEEGAQSERPVRDAMQDRREVAPNREQLRERRREIIRERMRERREGAP